ncbi:MAG TPA: HNH endonuclease signature motif containing protein [Gaiellales bacterium]|jgi:hypothetical protein|nr:HNH endonuclease signature motif containing protein [Gaiellales bacterium]
MRFIKGHNNPVTRLPTFVVEDRGYKTPCWAWQGRTIYSGYGITRGTDGVITTAHRAMYELHYGQVPDGLELDHLCRHRDCVNPDHVEAVTHLENVRRGSRSRRAAA